MGKKKYKVQFPLTFSNVFMLYHNGTTWAGSSYEDISNGAYTCDKEKGKKFIEKVNEIITNPNTANKEAKLKTLSRKTLGEWYSELRRKCLLSITRKSLAEDKGESYTMWLLGLLEITYSIIEETLVDFEEHDEKLISMLKNAYITVFDAYKIEFGLEGFELKNGIISSCSEELWGAFDHLEVVMEQYDEKAFWGTSWVKSFLCMQLATKLVDKLPEVEEKEEICVLINDIMDYFIDGPAIIDALNNY